MSAEMDIAGIKIAVADWNTTPERVKAVVTVLSERLAHIEEQLKQNSQNSSRPPSSDGFDKPNKSKVQKKKNAPRKTSNGGSSSKKRKLYPLEACSEVYCHVPEKCQHCGEQLTGEDEHPYRHQILEIPSLSAYIIEHQLHQLECVCCGQKTRGSLPKEVPSTGYGDRLAAVVAWLSGEHRQSHRMVESLMATLFSVETSFRQGNGDGANPKQIKGWLWVVATQSVKVFSVELSRAQATATELLGATFKGILISDRYPAYNWLDVRQRQVCWAHLKRDLTALAERSGVSKQIGLALLRRERRLFRWWHRVRDGTMSRQQLSAAVKSLRAGFKAELEAAAALPIGNREKSPLAKTVRTARQLLKLEPALWTFVSVNGVEPTNNLAEQALRGAVIWRRTSFGSQSQAGSEFVSRILTVVTSLKAQLRNPLDYLTEACLAKRLALSAPSLLPPALIDAEIPMLA